MEDLIETLRGAADYVLLDLPPLLAVADGLVLGPQSDGVLVIVDASATARGAAASLRTQLEQVGGRIIGGVFNNFDPAESRTYAYDYRTRYPYVYEGYASEEAPTSETEPTGDVEPPTEEPDPSAADDDVAPAPVEG